MADKKFYWLKLKENFFDEKHIRYMRKLPDGDKLIIVYLRMQLFSLKSEGVIEHSNILPTCAEEVALSLDEDVEIVKFALAALEKIGLVEIWDNQTVYMAAMQESIGSEGSSAERVRRHRERQTLHSNGQTLHSNSPVTIGNTEKREKRKEHKSKELNSLSLPSGSTQKKAVPFFEDDSVQMVLSKLLYDLILKNDPKHKHEDLQKWATHIDRLIRLDGRDRDEIESVIRWCQVDPFWHTNILSTAKLRKQFATMMLKMKNAQDGRHGVAQTGFSNPDDYRNLSMEV